MCVRFVDEAVIHLEGYGQEKGEQLLYIDEKSTLQLWGTAMPTDHENEQSIVTL